MGEEQHALHIGCSGWNYSSWRGPFYPQRLPTSRWLEHYARRFHTVEVNTTFYRLIAKEAVARWVSQTPEGFVFAVKASRYLTHVKRLADLAAGIERLYERLAPMRDAGRLGPILWQLPESLRRDDARLAQALAQLPPGMHAFEFRHQSWFASGVYALLREHDSALVIADHPDRRFQTCESTAGFSYVRLHYGHRGRRGNYSRTELASWAGHLERWRAKGPVFVYFNNDWEAFAPRDAAQLQRLLGP